MGVQRLHRLDDLCGHCFPLHQRPGAGGYSQVQETQAPAQLDFSEPGHG